MISIFSQKQYSEGKEFIYECSVDDMDFIHFVYGISKGKTSNQEQPLIDEVHNELLIDFPKFRKLINKLNFESYDDKLIDEGDKVKILSTKGELLISKRFLNESFNILEKMWIDDDELKEREEFLE